MGNSDSLARQIVQLLHDARHLYHRLVLVVGPAGSGKTAALQKVATMTSAPRINVNLELSRRMLDLTERQRALELPHLLSEIVAEPGSEVVLLDNIELLFDPAFKQDPLRLLQHLSRNRTIVAAWNGELRGAAQAGADAGTDRLSERGEHATLTYAVPGHPEHRRYRISGLLVAVTTHTKPTEQKADT